MEKFIILNNVLFASVGVWDYLPDESAVAGLSISGLRSAFGIIDEASFSVLAGVTIVKDI